MNLSDRQWVILGEPGAGAETGREFGREIGQQHSLTIDAFFDFICPWCLIGKRNLERAVFLFAGLRPDLQVTVRWRSHQLLPYTPLNGLPYQAFYRDRLGGAEAVAARRAEVLQAGHDAGIEFAFDRIEVLPNTTAAHELVDFAASRVGEVQRAALIDRLLTAYFMDGENIGDRLVLERLGCDGGLERESLRKHLAQSGDRFDPTGQRALHARPGVSGVPHFVFSTGYTFSGVHSPEVMVALMNSAARH
jgi:predicted DsbA family dithiol-disulfide isomerase